jgi:tetratricopeptide (TPR) repeat protein
LASCLLCTTLVLAARLAGAAPPSPPPPSANTLRIAKGHFKQGRAFQKAGSYDAAIREYQAAYGMVPLPELLFNMGQAYRLKGDKPHAIESYELFLHAAPEAQGSDEARAHVARLTREVEVENAAARPPDPAPAPAPTPMVDTPDRPRLPLDPARRLRIEGIVAASVGVIGLGIGLEFGLQARGDADDVSQRYNAKTASDGAAAQRNMYIATGLGGALMIGGGVLYYLGWRMERARLVPTVAGDRVGLSLAGTF